MLFEINSARWKIPPSMSVRKKGRLSLLERSKMSVDKMVAGWVRRRLGGSLAELLITLPTLGTNVLTKVLGVRLLYFIDVDKITWQGSSTNLEGLITRLGTLGNRIYSAVRKTKVKGMI